MHTSIWYSYTWNYGNIYSFLVWTIWYTWSYGNVYSFLVWIIWYTWSYGSKIIIIQFPYLDNLIYMKLWKYNNNHTVSLFGQFDLHEAIEIYDAAAHGERSKFSKLRFCIHIIAKHQWKPFDKTKHSNENHLIKQNTPMKTIWWNKTPMKTIW